MLCTVLSSLHETLPNKHCKHQTYVLYLCGYQSWICSASRFDSEGAHTIFYYCILLISVDHVKQEAALHVGDQETVLLAHLRLLEVVLSGARLPQSKKDMGAHASASGTPPPVLVRDRA